MKQQRPVAPDVRVSYNFGMNIFI